MKLNYTTQNQRLQVQIDANAVKDAFKQLAEFQEVFDEQQCGACESKNIYFRVRTVDGNDFFEMACKDCYAKLAFGQHKTGGGLFPKRKKQDGTFDRENKGWYKWNGNGN
ncbi:hypothetical protein GF342_02955 [Candidatus Woesearchaeota archaeon]|nr:hypothetical protein [Candidatus Woesearchaeota archaeon]